MGKSRATVPLKFNNLSESSKHHRQTEANSDESKRKDSHGEIRKCMLSNTGFVTGHGKPLILTSEESMKRARRLLEECSEESGGNESGNEATNCVPMQLVSGLQSGETLKENTAIFNRPAEFNAKNIGLANDSLHPSVNQGEI